MAQAKDGSKVNEGRAYRGKYGLSATSRAQQLDMFALDGELLRDAIASVVIEGDAVLFGMTRDLSACKIQLLSSDGKEEFYGGTTESFEDALRTIRDASKAF